MGDNADAKKVKAAISVAVQAKKDFEAIDKELNGKDGEVGDAHAKAMQSAESRATVDAALEALNKAKVELKTATVKFSKLDARGREAEADATARKAAARAASTAASRASKAAAEMAAKIADGAIATAEAAAAPAAEQKMRKVRKEEVMLGDADEVESTKKEQGYAKEMGFGLDPLA